MFCYQVTKDKSLIYFEVFSTVLTSKVLYTLDVWRDVLQVSCIASSDQRFIKHLVASSGHNFPLVLVFFIQVASLHESLLFDAILNYKI